MLDVDEYLTKFKDEEKQIETTEDTTHKESNKELTERSGETPSKEDLDDSYSVSQPGKSKRLSTSTNKQTPLFGRGK